MENNLELLLKEIENVWSGSFYKMTGKRAEKMGELLTTAKKLIKSGAWSAWLEDNLPFSQATAQKCVKIYNLTLIM